MLVVGVAAACGKEDVTPSVPSAAQERHGPVGVPAFDPDRFLPQIDNPFLSYAPGTRWVYEETTDEGTERVEVVVLDETREVAGVQAVVVRDTVTVDGELVEDTYDWFAQDEDGNVWYLGEDVKNYENGQYVDAAGSWEAGVDGAQAGILMWADPQPGAEYSQEYYRGEAEDMARVVALDGAADVPFGRYTDLVVIEEWTPLEPAIAERKYYARGVGQVLGEVVRGGSGRATLLSMQTR
jgi:hypothetical protein